MISRDTVYGLLVAIILVSVWVLGLDVVADTMITIAKAG